MRKDQRGRYRERNSVLKIYLQKIKKLIVDENGDLSYIENFDRVIEDIFGVKHFAKKLNQCYDDRDTIAVLNSFGLKNLQEIVSNPNIYQAFAELVALDARIIEIKRRIKRADKKGKKRDKDLVKEYEFLTNLYKKARKRMRSRFGVKSSKKSYKHKYSALSNLVERSGYDYDDDDDFSSVLYSSDMYDDDDEYDDMDQLSDLEEFARRLNYGDERRSRRSSGKTKRMNDLEDFDLDSEDDDDDDYDLDDDSDINTSSNKGFGKKIDQLASIVSNLANSVQYMLNSGYQNTQPYKPVSHAGRAVVPIHSFDDDNDYIVNEEPAPRKEQSPKPQYSSNADNLGPIYDAIRMLSENQNRLINTVDNIQEFLETLELEEINDEPAQPDISIQINKYEDVAAEAPIVTSREQKPEQNKTPNTEELIDQINHSSDNQ